MYLQSSIGRSDLPIQASLFNIRELFNEDFSPLIQQKSGRSSDDVHDIRPFLDEYKKELNTLLVEIFDPGVNFTQTDDIRKCGYCPYKGICNR